MYYHVRYEDVSVDEAIDLIMTLPNGALWKAAKYPYAEWTNDQYILADIRDAVCVQASGLQFKEPVEPIERPVQREHRKQLLEKARRTRERLNSTEWKEVDSIG